MDINTLETPCYIIDSDELNYNYESLYNAFSKHWKGVLGIGYSVKTNHLPWIMENMKQKGAYAEVVSSVEYQLAELIGFTPKQIIYNGPNKTLDTLERAVKMGSIVNIDTFPQIDFLGSFSRTTEIKVGLRVNFDLEEVCPNESSMGNEPSRFGFCTMNNSFKNALKRCEELNITVCGLHMHQSSKTRSNKVFKALAEKVVTCIKQYDMKDQLEYIDIGGGFFGGRNSKKMPTFDDYAFTICKTIKPYISEEKTQLIIEPGASLIATPISYLSKVIDVKDIKNQRFVTIDGSNLHVNPFLVNRKHPYELYSKEVTYEPIQIVCGSTCMENDRLLYLKSSPSLKCGDIVKIKNCGSYTMCFNSFFINSPPPVYVKNNNEIEMVREACVPEKLMGLWKKTL
ncbi:MAG: pyridoxal-dependent decarboxylase [Firmicutes bacterium HGW-Firmicutes-7]|nr:MAG: pyridoxal-dependent decarboxylase [Firmicutes bacterium HGW-Firmicutes-7]